MTVKELKEKRDKLAKMQWKEYTRLGNTQRCQELFEEIQKVEAEIERRTK